MTARRLTVVVFLAPLPGVVGLLIARGISGPGIRPGFSYGSDGSLGAWEQEAEAWTKDWVVKPLFQMFWCIFASFYACFLPYCSTD
uniref:Secreted protein n=1 Tax=Steinernema glaseri TaxID=37863 RepID=A0A1I8AFF1_9BILA